MFFVTEHINIYLFDEFGFAIIYRPKWSLYILLGFISINIFNRKR